MKPFNPELLSDKDVNSIALSIKNYHIPTGISMRIFVTAAMGSWIESFMIKGPVGKGLGITRQTHGTHIAFAAGTGVLVFVDLIARMVLTSLNLIPED